MDYLVSIKLSHLIDVKITEMEDENGRLEEGIFIPFKKNRIRKGNTAIRLNLIAREKKRSVYGFSHFITPNWGKGKELQDRIQKFGLAPFVGDMKPCLMRKRGFVLFRDVVNNHYIDDVLEKNRLKKESNE